MRNLVINKDVLINGMLRMCSLSVVALMILSACGPKQNVAMKDPTCRDAALAVIEMVKDRDTTYSAHVRQIDGLSVVQDEPDHLVCRGKGVFSDGKIAPILVTARRHNGNWNFTSEQGSHL